MSPMLRSETPIKGVGSPAPQVNVLISDLRRYVQLLEVDIKTEEARAYVFNLQDPAYPMLAKTLRLRRDNLVATISTLEAVAGAAH